ncbi:cytochrome P450 [Amycolatopsis pigmentata]|uniref:Cytochrome P450 n=1 Tax=Amycolatopsis pigmentata TaxID=450801 RepID=A0ABW5FZ16_9PSEU
MADTTSGTAVLDSDELDRNIFDDGVFDGFEPHRRGDPYPRYRALQDATPLYKLPEGVYLATRYHDCVSVLTEAKWGRADVNGVNPFAPEYKIENLPFLWHDPPDHTRLRRLVSKAFTPRAVAGWRPLVERTVTRLLDDALAAGEVDLVEAFAYPLPLIVISELLGVPEADRAQVGRWSSILGRGVDPGLLLPPDDIAARAQAMRDGVAYFRELIARRRVEPTDDIVSELVAVEEQGDVLSELELLNTCVMLLNAGFETTVSVLANGTLALMRNPAQLRLWRANPDIATAAVEELLRYEPPLQITTRVAHEEMELAGRTFAAGESLVLLIASANRDPDVFADPDRLDITRYGRQAAAPSVLSFGKGIHFCLGAALARLELEIGFDQLIRRSPGLAQVGDELSWLDNISLRRMRALPVRLR